MQHALELAGTEQPGNDLASEGWRGSPDAIEEPLDLFAGQEFVGVVRDDFAEMVGDHGRRLVDAAPGQLGNFSAVGVDPDSGLSGKRVDAIPAKPHLVI